MSNAELEKGGKPEEPPTEEYRLSPEDFLQEFDRARAKFLEAHKKKNDRLMQEALGTMQAALRLANTPATSKRRIWFETVDRNLQLRQVLTAELLDESLDGL